MPFVSGFLKIAEGPGGPVDPDYGVRPGLGGRPVDPGYGIGEGGMPGHELPEPPPGIWPPPVPAHPIVPVPPGEELPPGMIWPSPGHPAQPLPPRPGIPVPPGQPAPPIAGPPQKFVVLAWVPGYGFKYVVVDTSLKPQPKY